MRQPGSLGRQLAFSMVTVTVSMVLLTLVGFYMTYWLVLKLAPSLLGPEDSLIPNGADIAVIIVMSALGLVIASRVAFRMAVRIVEPVTAVAHAARLVAGGDLSARVTTGRTSSGEMTVLVDDFNAMAGRLERMASDAVAWNAQIAHELEPPSATAEWDGDRLECWACVQDPQGTRDTLAEALGIDKANIKVTPTWLGGAFGRKSKPDFVVEAALIAREIGKPVKVTWTREDDIRHGYYHSVSAQYCEAGLDDKGKCTAWLHRTVFPPISSTFDNSVTEPSDGEMSMGATDMPFAMPNLQIESGNARSHLRIGWLRSVANVYHAFAVQSFAAELAHAAGRDQKDYLLELIGPARKIDPAAEGATYGNYGAELGEYPIDTGRLRQVVERAAAMAKWGRKLPKGWGLGIAAHRSFLSYVATVVEVAVSADGTLTIPGVWVAVDAGTVINPRHVRAQMEGGTIYGLSNALYGAITAKDGAVVQDNFPSWRLMRMGEAPRAFEVEIVASDAPPGGVGEPPTPPAAPALANAIFAATGHRLRTLPFIGADGSKLALPTKQSA